MNDHSRCQKYSGLKPLGRGKIGQILLCLFIHAGIWQTCSKSYVAVQLPLLLRPLQLVLRASAWPASCCLLTVLVAAESPTAK